MRVGLAVLLGWVASACGPTRSPCPVAAQPGTAAHTCPRLQAERVCAVRSDVLLLVAVIEVKHTAHADTPGPVRQTDPQPEPDGPMLLHLTCHLPSKKCLSGMQVDLRAASLRHADMRELRSASVESFAEKVATIRLQDGEDSPRLRVDLRGRRITYEESGRYHDAQGESACTDWMSEEHGDFSGR